jgi:epoxide hydrolase
MSEMSSRAEPVIRPFRLAVSDGAIDHLHRRLDEAVWPPVLPHAADRWEYGVPTEYLQELISYWRTDFDWRAAESRINALPHFVTEIDDLRTHFIHLRSPEPNATPLLLVHGWPGSVIEFLEVAPRLADPARFGADRASAFHVVCPSLPGFGSSPPAQSAGMSPRRVARMHADLMTRLGYDRFVAQGGDWGSICIRYLPDICANRLLGLHFNSLDPIPPRNVENPLELLTPDEAQRIATWNDRQWGLTGYSHLQETQPQTLSFALSDSPVGLAAWITEKFHSWTDSLEDLREALSWDKLLTNIAYYWFTGCIGPSMHLYKEYVDAVSAGDLPSPRVRVPTGVANYPAEIWRQPRSWAEIEYHVVHWYDAPKGGHFAAMEQPEIFAGDLQTFASVLRAVECRESSTGA